MNVKYYSSYALIITGFAHLFCCGIPFIFGLNSIFSSLVVLDLTSLNFEFLESVEIYLFTLTTVIFLVLIFLEIYNKRIKSVENKDFCNEDQCDVTKKKVKFNIILACLLYVFNSFLLLSEIVY